MSKTFEQIEREIQREFIGASYDGWDVAEGILKEIIGESVRFYDKGIADGVDEDETEDTYVMYDSFETFDGELTIRIFYGDVTREVGYVSVTNK
jgi:hypothetical protein